MAGAEMEIQLSGPIPPSGNLGTRMVPKHFEKAAKKLIDSLLAGGVIRRATGNRSVLSPAFFVGKPNGDVRLVTDFKFVNKFIVRSIWPYPSVEDIMRTLQGSSRYFAVLDCIQGYFHM